MAWDRMAPWNSKSERLISYVTAGQTTDYANGAKIVWRDANEQIKMTLTFEGFSRGRSAAHALWKDARGRSFVMFLTDLAELIREGTPIATIEGRWIVVKRGQDYGIKKAP